MLNQRKSHITLNIITETNKDSFWEKLRSDVNQCKVDYQASYLQ